MSREVERKFLVKVSPDLSAASGRAQLRQGYLAVDGEVEVRLRESDGSTTMTIKAGANDAGDRLSRTEVEVDLDSADADALWSHAAERSLQKVRHRFALPDGLVAELDVYEGALAGLVVVEVEFADEDAARAFLPPDWFDREVTGDARWSNAALAQHGLPT